MGRHTKPTKLKLHEGNPGKRELPPEPEPSGIPHPADWLDEHAMWLWNRVVPGLIDTGVATSADEAELIVMCDMWSRYRRMGALDDPTYQQYMQMLTAVKLFHSIAGKFGMNPSDRAGIVAEKPKQQDKVGKYLA